jgi:hypothetical protein
MGGGEGGEEEEEGEEGEEGVDLQSEWGGQSEW